MATLALSAAKYLFNRSTKKHNNNVTMGIGKTRMSGVKKLRLFLSVPAVALAVTMLLGCLLVFAGSKAGMMEDLSVFTLNVSRIGEGLHQKVDGAIAGFNLDGLHIDLKRSAPVHIPARMTATPTTLLTMAARDLGSDFKSLTSEAGENVESAKSTAKSVATSRVSQVKSKASSAANSVESSVNSGLDGAADKTKAKLKALVDESFKDIISALDLQGFYSIHVSSTCEGDFVKGDGEDPTEHKKVDSCKKTSPLNPMGIVAIFYWAGIIFTAVALAFNLMAIYKPGLKWIKWTMFFLVPAFFMMGIASALSHGIAESAQRLVNFIGDGISVSGIAGMKFIATTWAVTILILVEGCILLAIRWYIKKYPEATSNSGSGSGGFAGTYISAPQPQITRPEPTANTGRDFHGTSGPPVGGRESLDDCDVEMDRLGDGRYGSVQYADLRVPPPQNHPPSDGFTNKPLHPPFAQPPRGGATAPGGAGWA